MGLKPVLTVQRAVAWGLPLLVLLWLVAVAAMFSQGWRFAPVAAFLLLLLLIFVFRCPRCGVPLGVTAGLVPRAPRKCLRCGLDFYGRPILSPDNARLRRDWVAVHGPRSAGLAANLKWMLFGRLPKDF